MRLVPVTPLDSLIPVPRPRKEEEKGLVLIARACANYPKKTWGNASLLYLVLYPGSTKSHKARGNALCVFSLVLPGYEAK